MKFNLILNYYELMNFFETNKMRLKYQTFVHSSREELVIILSPDQTTYIVQYKMLRSKIKKKRSKNHLIGLDEASSSLL